MQASRKINARLAAVIDETGLSHAQVARAFVRVAQENGAHEHANVGRSHVSHWVAGTKPSGRAPEILCEALSRRLGRIVTLDDIGAEGPSSPLLPALDWRADTLLTLADLGKVDVDVERRRVLAGAAYSVAALALPAGTWWANMAERHQSRADEGPRNVGKGDLDAVRDMISLFSQVDQRRGGGHARSAVVQYLTSDVAGHLRGRYVDPQIRRAMFSAAGELAYLSGWMAFDNGDHAIAQRYFSLAVKLSAEAVDPPLTGHILRAMAHQAIDLGHHRHALDLATASIHGQRYGLAGSRERALIGVVHARALAADGQAAAAMRALRRAEDDLSTADTTRDEPARVFFFGEASLAHETACTLRDSGDLTAAAREFRRSVRRRKAESFTRTHAVTLGYLGAVQSQQGLVEEACSTWSAALDAMVGIRSGRVRQVAVEMRSVLSTFRKRGVRGVNELDARAAEYLADSA